MSWIDTLDRLITDSWAASRDESAVMLDSLLKLGMVERWELFAHRDPRLMFLSDEDYQALFHSLNAHAAIAEAADGAALAPVTDEATAVLPVETAEHAYAEDDQAADHEGASAVSEPYIQPRSWWRTHTGVRWLSLAVAAATALMLVGGFLTVIVLFLLPSGASRHAQAGDTLLVKLDEVERDQAQFAKRLVQVDTQLSDLAATVDNRFGIAMHAVKFGAALDKLQATIDRGVPFADELQTVAPVIADNPALAALVSRLDGYSATGVPSLTALQERFQDVAPRLTDAKHNPIGQVFNWLSSGFGLIEGSELHRFHEGLAAVAASLHLGDLKAAAGRLEQLHPYPAEAADQWLAAVRIRLDADAAVDAMRQSIIANPPAALAK